MRATPVDEVTEPSWPTPERFRAEYVRRARPVVLRGFVSSWPARSWDFPGLREHLPNRRLEGCGLSATDGLNVRKVSLTREELVARLTGVVKLAGEPPDWFFDVPTELPELRAALPPPPVTSGPFRYGVALGADTVTRGHYHTYEHALISQVHGEKRVVLYPPWERLYPFPRRLRHSPHEYSRVDFAEPDVATFPRVAAATRFETTLHAGDALFVPVHWWHAVYGAGPIFSVSLLWNARFADYRFRASGLRVFTSAVAQRALPPLRAVLAAGSVRRLIDASRELFA
ncbi:MAG TPA: cupin-like domain-containing protein [Polyangiaceae bacterium]|jgi:hypothetical protein|nr:cupin-like domain-containing protein [Polyangiaceae bacterium]